MDKITKFFEDLGNAISFIWTFSTDEKISRLRVFVLWFFAAVIPSFVIYNSINHWQTHIPGLNTASQTSGVFWSMIFGTSIIPILFFITNGLRGYHKLFNELTDLIYSRFERKTLDELEMDYGSEGIEHLKAVNLGRFIGGFFTLELIIVGWATINYFLVGGNFTGLAWLGYVGDDLFMGAVVFVLESIYCIKDGLMATNKVYKLKLATVQSDAVTKAEVDEMVEQ